MTTHATALMSAAVLDAARVLVAQLPADSAWSVETLEGPDELIATRAVAASLTPDVRLALTLTSGFARGLIVGPPPADSLTEAVEQGFRRVAEVLGDAWDFGPVDAVELTEVDPKEVGEPTGGPMYRVRLLDGAEHVATMIVETAESSVEAPAETPAFEQLPAGPAPVSNHPISLLSDVEMGVTVELGRARMTVGEILGLTIGSVIELDRLAGSPVDVLVNGTLIGRGEVVVIDEEFGVRVSEVVGYQPVDKTKRCA